MSALAGLAANPVARKPGARWEPPPEQAEQVIAARRANWGYEAIAKALNADGIEVGKSGVKAWLDRQGIE